MNIIEVKEKLKRFITDELLNRTDYPIGDDEPLVSGGWVDSFSLAQIGCLWRMSSTCTFLILI